MATGPSIVCWGELVWDLFADGPRLGGTAANVAYHLARLGARAVLASRVGDDELGRRALGELEGAGVDVSHVQIDAACPTGTVTVSIEEGEPRFVIGERAAWERMDVPPGLVPILARSAGVCFGTLAQRAPLGCAALRRVLGHCAGHRLLDLNIRPPHVSREVLESVLERATVVKLNEAEHALVADLLGVRDPVQALLARGVELVALTRGSRGAELHDASGALAHGGFPLVGHGGDRVGAGDAFTAVLLLGLCGGTPRRALLAKANRYASLVASSPGAMPPVPPEWRSRLDRETGV